MVSRLQINPCQIAIALVWFERSCRGRERNRARGYAAAHVQCANGSRCRGSAYGMSALAVNAEGIAHFPYIPRKWHDQPELTFATRLVRAGARNSPCQPHRCLEVGAPSRMGVRQRATNDSTPDFCEFRQLRTGPDGRPEWCIRKSSRLPAKSFSVMNC
jgi:hypothetical protein